MFKKTIVTLIVLIALLLVFLAFMNGPMPMSEQQTESGDASRQAQIDRHKLAREHRQKKRLKEEEIYALGDARAIVFAKCMGVEISTVGGFIFMPTRINGKEVPTECMSKYEQELVTSARRAGNMMWGEDIKEIPEKAPSKSSHFVTDSGPFDLSIYYDRQAK